MFKRLPFWFVALLVPADFFAFAAGGMVAWISRFHPFVQSFKPVIFRLSFVEYVPLVLSVAALNTIVVALLGLYRVRQEMTTFTTGIRLVVASAVTFSVITSVIFFRQELFESRYLVVVGWLCATALLLIERGFMNLVIGRFAAMFGFGSSRFLLIGEDHVSERISAILKDEAALGISVAKKIPFPDVAEVRRLLEEDGIDEILLTDPNVSKEAVTEIVELANEHHVRFSFVPNLFQMLTVNAVGAMMGDVPVVELRRTPLEGWGRILKRTLDIVGSLFAFIFLAPVFVIIAIVIKLDSPGSIFYWSTRVGPKGNFRMVKFRTMKMEYCTGEDAPNAQEAERVENELIAAHNSRRGPVPKVLNDPRRTRAGRFLERTSLDELPQFWNALTGSMSIVGPRPHVPKEVARYEKLHRRVFTLKPGITGLAQISGRSDLDFNDEVRLDLHYIENWSLLFDIIIIIKTPFVIVLRRHRS